MGTARWISGGIGKGIASEAVAGIQYGHTEPTLGSRLDSRRKASGMVQKVRLRRPRKHSTQAESASEPFNDRMSKPPGIRAVLSAMLVHHSEGHFCALPHAACPVP
jgi:hypothetical protein